MKTEILPHTQHDADMIDFPDLVRTLSRYKWGVAAITVLAAFGALFYVFAATPIYRGTAVVLVESKASKPIQTDEDVYDPGAGTYEYYATQYKLMAARSVVEAVVDKLDLVNNPEFKKDTGASLMNLLLGPVVNLVPWVGQVFPGINASMSGSPEVRRREAVIRDFQKNLDVEEESGTQLAEINYDAKSPELAAQIANEVANQYLEASCSPASTLPSSP